MPNILENWNNEFKLQDKHLHSLFQSLFEIRQRIQLSVHFDTQMISQEFFIDFVSKVQHSGNIFLKTLSLKENPTQTKESLCMLAPLVRQKLVEEVDLSQLEIDDDFIIDLVETLQADPHNPLQFLCLGRVSLFGCEFIARNIDCLRNIQTLELEEDPANRFSPEVKRLLIENVRSSRGRLLFCNVRFADASDEFVNPLIEVNELLRRKRLEKQQETVIEREYRNADLADISAADANRLCLSFSEKNYLDSVFGNILEKSIFEIKNFQEKQRKQKEKLLMNCSDEPEFAIDDNIFTSDGFSLLLCRKLIDKFGLELKCGESEKENQV